MAGSDCLARCASATRRSYSGSPLVVPCCVVCAWSVLGTAGDIRREGEDNRSPAGDCGTVMAVAIVALLFESGILEFWNMQTGYGSISSDVLFCHSHFQFSTMVRSQGVDAGVLSSTSLARN